MPLFIYKIHLVCGEVIIIKLKWQLGASLAKSNFGWPSPFSDQTIAWTILGGKIIFTSGMPFWKSPFLVVLSIYSAHGASYG